MDASRRILVILFGILGLFISSIVAEDDLVMSPSKLRMFVDELLDIPRVKGYSFKNGMPVPKSLKIGMFSKKWKFHRDLPATPVFAYGTSRRHSTIPGPTIEALHGVDTYVTWQNHLPSKHILPWDPTIPTAVPPNKKGVPTVVHLHGGIDEPESDGNANSWFTSGFREKGMTWTKKRYHYHNIQHPGTLWYHDHAMGLTRVNLLAGLFGAYIIRQPNIEAPLGLPYNDEEFEHTLMVFDRSFREDGSIYMNATGNNPSIHPQWQPEYFGDAIIVNGKAWPFMKVKRRKYRFRIINASNARFFRFYLTNNLTFIHVASDSAYNERPVILKELLLSPSEIADVIIDFAKSKSETAILANDAPYPMIRLVKYPSPNLSEASQTRYIAMYEYASEIDEPTHLYMNGKPYDAPATETPKPGTSEVCPGSNRIGKRAEVPAHEKGWKNVFKMMPGHVTKIFVRFSFIHSNGSYPFDATAEPGYVYHCHILDHEDNAMMRPLKFIH
ncbi:hypothetical protein Leryth_011266 [Lithospermum erythrorhizon]|nr:hypothetical protein Leryth_011266 [Lithospermum erythrorhizon]